MKKLVLFDLDGTLTDSAPGIIASFQYALKCVGMPVVDREALFACVGPPLKDSFVHRFGLSEEKAALAIEAYRSYFRINGKMMNQVYPQIPELLAALRARGQRLAVATSKLTAFSRDILEHFGLMEQFDFLAGSEPDGKTRMNKAEVVRYVLENMRVKPEEAILVGDREYDVFGAHEAGIPCLGVLYGYGSREELCAAGADFLAETVPDIARFV